MPRGEGEGEQEGSLLPQQPRAPLHSLLMSHSGRGGWAAQVARCPAASLMVASHLCCDQGWAASRQPPSHSRHRPKPKTPSPADIMPGGSFASTPETQETGERVSRTIEGKQQRMPYFKDPQTPPPPPHPPPPPAPSRPAPPRPAPPHPAKTNHTAPGRQAGSALTDGRKDQLVYH